jgi:hypothetical protein
MESLLGQASRWIDDGEKAGLFRLLAINNQIISNHECRFDYLS